MIIRLAQRRGFTIIEYVFLIIIILLVILVMRNYVLRSMGGKYKSVGDTYGFGRQYDVERTISCGYDDRLNIWYDEACFDNERQRCLAGNHACEKDVINGVNCRRNSDMCNKSGATQ